MNAIYNIFILIFFLILGITLTNHPIQIVKVHENDTANSKKIIDKIGDNANASFYNIDLNKIKTEVEKISWIYKVNVEKTWPNKLDVKIIEHSPVAVWNSSWALSKTGDVFYIEKKLDKNYPTIDAKINNNYVKDIFLLINNFFNEKYIQISSVNFVSQSLIQIEIEKGPIIKVDQSNAKKDLEKFFANFEKIFSTNNPFNLIKIIDLRYQFGIAIEYN
jgi:cell division protein FtsQ